MSSSRAAIALACTALGWAAAWLPARSSARRPAERAYTFPILFHVATGADGPVVQADWFTPRVDAAARALRPARVDFTFSARAAPSTVPPAMQTREQRDALQALVRDGFVNVFVVRELRSWEPGGGIIRGVHWHRTHHRGGRGEHYIIIASYAAEYVLAHELGHFFGNPRHSRVRGNLMSYLRGKGVPTLDRHQVRRVRRAARRYARTGELRVIDAPSR